MLHIAKGGLLIATAALLTGCGVLGIATKGDLRRQQDEAAAETQAVRDELESVSQELAALDRSIATVQASLANLEGLRDSVEDLAIRLDDTKLRITNVEGRTRQELDHLDNELSVATADATAARDIALTADERGRAMTTAYVEGLRAERRRLQRELDEIQEHLDDIGSAGAQTQAAR
jgi:chromosome segregation ATPase